MRQWDVVDRLAGRIAAATPLEGAILIGSLARGDGDELSDVDVIAIVRDGQFSEAWRARAELEGDEALIAWDETEPGRSELRARKWLTRDVVLVECLLATAASGVRLAEPFRVLVGDSQLPHRLTRRPPISRSEITAHVAGREAAGHSLHNVEKAYAALVRAVRRPL